MSPAGARMATQGSVPERVLAAYRFAADAAEPLDGGLINATYVVRERGRPRAVLQRLHPIFAAEVNIDLDVVTAHIDAAGMDTPRLVHTSGGARWIEHEGRIWRALTYLDGTTIHRVESPGSARAAGELVGRFHRAVRDLSHAYAFTRAGVHDTAGHLARLERALETASLDAPVIAEACALGRDIVRAAADLPALEVLAGLPRRHTHGDLKISNILFAPGDIGRARCLLDLDTLGLQSMAYELGDALRSWCNPGGEDAGSAAVDCAIFAAAMEGYRAGAGDLLIAAERASIVPGLETVCVELAARFCVDVFDDSYFGWDSGRYPSRREHNLVRARGQLALARSVRAQARVLTDLV
jgi:Ser/Thr protein kinase RdoA (MazF antagonist)